MSLTSLEPESSASANSAISANHEYYYSIAIRICQHLFSNFFRKIIFSSFFYFCLLVSVLDVCEHYIQSCLPSFPEQNILHAYRKPVHTVPYEACHLHLDTVHRYRFPQSLPKHIVLPSGVIFLYFTLEIDSDTPQSSGAET